MDLGLQGQRAIVPAEVEVSATPSRQSWPGKGVDVAIVARNKTDLEATASQLGSETNQRILPRSDPMPTQLLRLFSSLGNNSSLSSGKVLAFEIPARGAASDARDELEDRHLEGRG
jgi:hypothetical protein